MKIRVNIDCFHEDLSLRQNDVPIFREFLCLSLANYCYKFRLMLSVNCRVTAIANLSENESNPVLYILAIIA